MAASDTTQGTPASVLVLNERALAQERAATDDVWQSRIAEVLSVHRWKSMGISSVSCECGVILYESGSSVLRQFPADEAFRKHLANMIVRAIR